MVLRHFLWWVEIIIIMVTWSLASFMACLDDQPTKYLFSDRFIKKLTVVPSLVHITVHSRGPWIYPDQITQMLTDITSTGIPWWQAYVPSLPCIPSNHVDPVLWGTWLDCTLVPESLTVLWPWAFGFSLWCFFFFMMRQKLRALERGEGGMPGQVSLTYHQTTQASVLTVGHTPPLSQSALKIVWVRL